MNIKVKINVDTVMDEILSKTAECAFIKEDGEFKLLFDEIRFEPSGRANVIVSLVFHDKVMASFPEFCADFREFRMSGIKGKMTCTITGS